MTTVSPAASGVRERPAFNALNCPIAPTANRLVYMLGGLPFVGILLLMITGILIDQYCNPRRAAEARRTSSRPFAVPFKSKKFLMVDRRI